MHKALIASLVSLFLATPLFANGMVPDPEPLPSDVTPTATLADGEKPDGELKARVDELQGLLNDATGVERERAALELLAIGGEPASQVKSDLGKMLNDAKKDLTKIAVGCVKEIEKALKKERKDFGKRVSNAKRIVPQLGIGKKADTKTMREQIEPVLNSYFPPADRLKDSSEFVEAGTELKRLARLYEHAGGKAKFDPDQIITDAAAKAEKDNFYKKLGGASRVFQTNEKYRSILDEHEFKLVEMTNVYRVIMGKKALTINPKLCKAAKGHSKDMKEQNFFSHDSPVPGKKKFSQRAAKEGASAMAENISRAGPDASNAFWGWFISTGHHFNMLVYAGGQIGIGRVGEFWTEMF